MATATSATSIAAPRKLRIMALHGYTSNAFVLQRRMGALRKACRDVCDFVFVNGPMRVEPITSSQPLDTPEASAAGKGEEDDDLPLEEQPRAWWRANDDDGTYQGFDDSLRFLAGEIRDKGPFDGVFGFSQGAGLAALLASAFEDPSRLSPKRRELLFPPESSTKQGPLRFCIAVSGFRARDPTLQALFPTGEGHQQQRQTAHGIQTPVLHVLGKADQIVDEERSQTLVDVCAHSRVEMHESGHVVPTQAPWRNFLRDFVHAFADETHQTAAWKEVQGPNERPKGQILANGESPLPSGANTPKEQQQQEEDADATKRKPAL